MHGDETRRQPPTELPDDALWRRSRSLDAVADDAARFLDLAGFADGVLDVDDHERVAAWVSRDPEAAEDVAAARAAATADPMPPPETVVARALALVDAEPARRGNVVPLPLHPRTMPTLRWAAGWGSLVAAMVIVGWLGFNLGMDASLSVTGVSQASDEGFLQEWGDPSASFLRVLNEGVRT
jgi:anti-sigma factor RsiW